jgi:DNA-directed RNA polymerase alpha subunit
MSQTVDYKQKYKDARKELSELKKIVQRQDKYIVRLLDRLAEKNKKELHQENKVLEKARERSRLLAKELKETQRQLEEKSESLERMTRLRFKNIDLQALKKESAPIIDPRPHPSKPQQSSPQRYVSDYMSALLDCGIDALRLNSKIAECLEAGGIETVYDLVTISKSDLLKIEGMTSSRLDIIRQKIKPMNLEIEMPVKYIPEARKYVKL